MPPGEVKGNRFGDCDVWEHRSDHAHHLALDLRVRESFDPDRIVSLEGAESAEAIKVEWIVDIQ